MNLAPADYEAWSQATGQPYPSSAAERARVTPEVRAWKQQQLSAAQQPQERNALGDVLVPALGLLGVSAAGIGAYRHLRNRGATPEAAADMAVDVDQAAAAIAPTASTATAAAAAAAPANTGYAPAQQRQMQEDLSWRRATERQQPGGPLLTAQLDNAGRERSVLEEVTQQGSESAKAAGERRNHGKGASRTALAQQILALRDQPEAWVAALADARSQMSSSEHKQFVAEMSELVARHPERGIDPNAYAQGLSDLQKYAAASSYELDQLAVNREGTKGNQSSRSDWQERNQKSQSGSAIVKLIKKNERERGASVNPYADLQRSEYSAQEGPMGETLHNSAQIQEAVLAANPRRANESGSAYGRRIKGVIDSLSTARTPKGPKVETVVDPKLAEVFYQDSDGQLRIYQGAIGEDRKTRRAYTVKKGDGTPIALSDLQYFPVNDASWYERGGQLHPFLSLDEVRANQQSADFVKPRYFDVEDPLIKGLQEALPRHMVLKGLAAPETAPDGPIGIRYGTRGPGGTYTPDANLTYLQEGWQQAEPGSGPARAGAVLRVALEAAEARNGRKLDTTETLALAQRISKEFNSDLDGTLRAAAMHTGMARSKREAVDQRALAAYYDDLAATREANNAVTGWTGQAPQAHRVGLPAKGDSYSQLVNALGRHAGADAVEMEDFIRSGNLQKAGEALMRAVPRLGDNVATLLPKAAKDEVASVVAEGIMAGLADLNAVLQQKPELAAKFGIDKPDGFGVRNYLEKYVGQWSLLRGIDLADNPTYQVPADSLELVLLEARDQQSGAVDPISAFQDFTAKRRNAARAVMDLEYLTKASRSSVELDPNRNATEFARTLFTGDDPDLLNLQARSLRDSLQDKEINLNFATRRRYDATQGFFPTKSGRNPSEIDLQQQLEAYSANIDGRAYPANSALMATIKGSDSDAPGFAAKKQQILEQQQWLDDNQDFIQQSIADLNRGNRTDRRQYGPGRPIESVGSGFRLTANGLLEGASNTRPVEYRMRVENDADTTPLDRREEQAFVDQNAPEVREEARELDDISRAGRREPLVSTDVLTSTQQQNIRGPISTRNLGILLGPEPSEDPAVALANEYGLGTEKAPLKFKALGGTENAASEGDAAKARPFLQDYLTGLQEQRAAAAQLDRDVFVPSFTGPEPGATVLKLGDSLVPLAAQPASPSRGPWRDLQPGETTGGWMPTPEERALSDRIGRLSQEQLGAVGTDRLGRLADLESRIAQSQADLESRPAVIDFTQTQALPQSTSWSPQAPQPVSQARQSVPQSLAGDIDQLEQQARALRARAPQPEGNLFGQLDETPRSAITQPAGFASATPLGALQAAPYISDSNVLTSMPADGLQTTAGRMPIEQRVRRGDRLRPDGAFIPEGDAAGINAQSFVDARAGGFGPARGTAFSDNDGRTSAPPRQPLVIEGAAERARAADAAKAAAASAARPVSSQEIGAARLQHLYDYMNKALKGGHEGTDTIAGNLRPAARGQNALTPYAAPSPALLQQLARVARSRALV